MNHNQQAIIRRNERDTQATNRWLRSFGVDPIKLESLSTAKDVWLLLKAKRFYGYMSEQDKALYLSLWHHTYTLEKPMSQHNKNLFRNMFKRQDRERKRK
jgi:hypothetical protein